MPSNLPAPGPTQSVTEAASTRPPLSTILEQLKRRGLTPTDYRHLDYAALLKLAGYK